MATREAPLRSGCASDSAIRATVPAGAPLTIRSVMTGDSGPCYKVAATVDGKTVEGYIDAGAIGGVEDFDRTRRDAERLNWGQVQQAFHLPGIPPSAPSEEPGAEPSAGLAAQAISLIDNSQPQKALELLQPHLQNSRDPNLLALAGAAAWRADDTLRAVEYWRASLDLRPNPELQTLHRKLLQENQNDHSAAKLIGMRVQLRYDADAIPAESARQILGTLDSEYARITAELGCPVQERVIAVAQTREAYLKSTQAAEWSGGQYDGRIHVPVAPGTGGTNSDPNLHRTLAHEMVHACLTMMGQWPSWLQEGLAQKLSGDTLSPAGRKQLTDAARAGRLPKLMALGQNWSGLDIESARVAYAESLAAVELFYENYNGLGLRNLLRSPERLKEITVDLDRLLRQ